MVTDKAQSIRTYRRSDDHQCNILTWPLEENPLSDFLYLASLQRGQESMVSFVGQDFIYQIFIPADHVVDPATEVSEVPLGVVSVELYFNSFERHKQNHPKHLTHLYPDHCVSISWSHSGSWSYKG